MLRLLNHFKRDLLSKGKIKSFLFYTVGEIFLVVVGILIALQIDNWNRELQEEKELNEYLIKITENISSDLELADSLLNRRFRIKQISQKGLNVIASREEKSIEFATESIILFNDFEFSSKKAGFESLVTSGYISKLRRSRLDSLLFQYYMDIDELKRAEQSFNGFIEAMEKEINTSFSLFSVYKSAMGYEDREVVRQKALNSLFEVIPLQNAFLRGSSQIAITNRYRAIIETGTLLRLEIERKVKN